MPRATAQHRGTSAPLLTSARSFGVQPRAHDAPCTWRETLCFRGPFVGRGRAEVNNDPSGKRFVHVVVVCRKSTGGLLSAASPTRLVPALVQQVICNNRSLSQTSHSHRELWFAPTVRPNGAMRLKTIPRVWRLGFHDEELIASWCWRTSSSTAHQVLLLLDKSYAFPLFLFEGCTDRYMIAIHISRSSSAIGAETFEQIFMAVSTLFSGLAEQHVPAQSINLDRQFIRRLYAPQHVEIIRYVCLPHPRRCGPNPCMWKPTLSFALNLVVILIFFLLFLRYIRRHFTARDEYISGPLQLYTFLTFMMRKFLDKAKGALDQQRGDSAAQVPLQASANQIQSVSSADVLRYRYHHGANLGSIFVLEKWLTGSMFVAGAKGTSELAAVQAAVAAEGMDGARARFERHWREYVSDADLDWLRDVGRCTTVRLPIGYFTLGPAYCQNTPFQPVAGVYQNAWQAVKDLVRRCADRGIGTLVDMHALPGGANKGDHSGTNSGKAELWSSKGDRDLATRSLLFVAQQVRSMEGVTGLQIINEADWNAPGMYEWYSSTIGEISKVDNTLPVYISDGWDLGKAVSWCQGLNKVTSHGAPVVIDTHLYWCFSDADKQKSPQQIADEVQHKLGALDGKDGSVIDRGAVQAIVGEYSCVLSDASWAKGGGTPKDDLVRLFGHAQSQRWQQRAGGSCFWTYRMDWMPGGEWGFKKMTELHAITAPAALTLSAADVQTRVQQAHTQQAQRKQTTVAAHVHYWDTNHPGQYEHWRFEQGWDTGYTDALAFFHTRAQHGRAGADTIGMLDMWVLKRLRDSGQAGKFVWEFEQGLRQGVQECYKAVGL
nr:glucan 1,3-beta-glucosidase 3 [Quercus suber]